MGTSPSCFARAILAARFRNATCYFMVAFSCARPPLVTEAGRPRLLRAIPAWPRNRHTRQLRRACARRTSTLPSCENHRATTSPPRTGAAFVPPLVSNVRFAAAFTAQSEAAQPVKLDPACE